MPGHELRGRPTPRIIIFTIGIVVDNLWQRFNNGLAALSAAIVGLAKNSPRHLKSTEEGGLHQLLEAPLQGPTMGIGRRHCLL